MFLLHKEKSRAFPSVFGMRGLGPFGYLGLIGGERSFEGASFLGLCFPSTYISLSSCMNSGPPFFLNKSLIRG